MNCSHCPVGQPCSGGGTVPRATACAQSRPLSPSHRGRALPGPLPGPREDSRGDEALREESHSRAAAGPAAPP